MTELALKGLRKEFGSSIAVERIDLAIGSGELVALLGPSGCGKTTTLRMIAGLDAPTAGKILFDGRDVSGVPVQARNVGLVSQRFALFPHMNVEQNVAFGLAVRDTPRRETTERVEEILDIVQLTRFRDRFPAQLSGGQMQRVALARTLVTKPSVLMLDEPLASLDAALRGEMRRFIRELQQRLGMTTIFVTHDQTEAMEIADRIAVLFDGVLEQFDTPAAIYHRPATPAIARFTGASNLFEATIAPGGKLLTAFGALDIAPGLCRADGGTVLAMIRSESIGMTLRGAGGDGVAGIVQTAGFTGASVLYTVKVGETVLTVDERSARKLDPGTPVTLKLPPERIWIFGDAPKRRGRLAVGVL